MLNGSPALPAGAVDQLRGALAGTAHQPGDAGYDDARAAWNLVVQQHPALVVRAANADDVATAVRFAAAHGLDIAVQATGHGVVRPADGALLINTASLTGVTIDPEAHTATVAAGTQWAEVLAAGAPYGLAPLLGSTSHLGAVGYTLGGGLGWLGRKYGLACDSALRFEVVTADGHRLAASADENPDLFWGLRGGGSSLAIVTAMTVRLYPVTTVYGGQLIYPGHMAADVLHRWRDWTRDVPEELTSSVKIMNMPDMEIVPPPLRGQTVVILAGCACGPLEQGEALLAPWREWRAPMLDAFGPLPFTQVDHISQDPVDPLPAFVSGAWLRELSDDAIAALVRFGTLQEVQLPILFLDVRHAGGAVSRPSDSAFGYRDAELLLQIVGLVVEPPLREALGHAFTRLKHALGPALAGTVYMNFLEGPEAVEQVRHGFPSDTFARLSALKAQYDPHGRLNRSMAIPLP